MAEKRMFSSLIVESDAFLDMSFAAQVLYFQLSMDADGEGFHNAPKRFARLLGIPESALQELIDKRFLLLFDSGIVVVKHWHINNYVRPDRTVPTLHQEERARLFIKSNGAYTFDESQADAVLTASKVVPYCWSRAVGSRAERGQNAGNPRAECGQSAGNFPARLDKTRLDKTRLESNNPPTSPQGGLCVAKFTPPTLDEVKEYIKEKGYHFDPESFLAYYESNGWVQANGKAKIKSWKACCVTWEHRHDDGGKGVKKHHDFGEYGGDW